MLTRSVLRAAAAGALRAARPAHRQPDLGVVAFVFAYFAHRFFTFRTMEEKFEAIEGGEGAER